MDRKKLQTVLRLINDLQWDNEVRLFLFGSPLLRAHVVLIGPSPEAASARLGDLAELFPDYLDLSTLFGDAYVREFPEDGDEEAEEAKEAEEPAADKTDDLHGTTRRAAAAIADGLRRAADALEGRRF
jgi:hypothetical protein